MDDPSTASTEGFGLMYYNARWYDSAIGRFAQADSVTSSGVQGPDKYAYVGNNSINRTDPTGHKCLADDGCDTPHGDNPPPPSPPTPGGGTPGGGTPDGGTPGGGTPSDGTPSGGGIAYTGAGIGYTDEDGLCYDDGVTKNCTGGTNYWDWEKEYNFPLLTKWLAESYHLDAGIGGFVGGAGVGSIFNTAGAENVAMIKDGVLQVQAFKYFGQGSGAGGSVSDYGGVVFNLKDFKSYEGDFNTYNFSAGVGTGITISYFHDANEAPFKPGTVQGFSISGAGVLGVSYSMTHTHFQEIHIP